VENLERYTNISAETWKEWGKSGAIEPLIETIVDEDEHHIDSSEQYRSMSRRRSITEEEFGTGGHPGRYDRDKRDDEMMEMNRRMLEMMERFTLPSFLPTFFISTSSSTSTNSEQECIQSFTTSK